MKPIFHDKVSGGIIGVRRSERRCSCVSVSEIPVGVGGGRSQAVESDGERIANVLCIGKVVGNTGSGNTLGNAISAAVYISCN